MKKILIFFVLFTSILPANETIIKMATIAPEGTSWMKEMHAFEDRITELTDGKIKFKTYAGGVMGGEIDMLRKMRYGQVDAAAFTGVGLGEILPEVRVLELPFMFQNSEEVDFVFNALLSDFQQKFLEKGFYFVSWAETGFVYLFTQTQVQNARDLQNTKMWLWKDDPLAREVFDVMDIPAVPLDVTDVYTSLQANLVNGFYISPYACIAMQWFTKAEFMLNYPLTHSLGGVLMTRKKMESLPKELQSILIEETQKGIRQIVLQTREENAKSMDILQQNGIKLVDPENESVISQFKQAGDETALALVGKLYPQETLNKVKSLLDEYRKSK
ncbi:MAG: TRAP transporter substrate-binding protein DctP [Candidatus Marinimicrobia bacterium]|nr:TRAP transporter substrate-binding protein DctP [Candidatus Neomarinimicrobiota bacterium]